MSAAGVARQALAHKVDAWSAELHEPRDWDEDGWANALGSVVHLAYHVGAIRQIDAAASGPPARD
jgi:hypothetical protein